MITEYTDKTDSDFIYKTRSPCQMYLITACTLPLLVWPYSKFFQAQNLLPQRENLLFDLTQEIRCVTSLFYPLWELHETLQVNESPSSSQCQPLYVRTEVLRFWLWTLHCCSGTKSSGLFHSAWASVSSEQSGWQRTRHQHWYYKGLKTDRAPEALASLPPWILHNKVHNTQYPHLSCPPFMIPVRGPMDL